jgi:hypothetical protein
MKKPEILGLRKTNPTLEFALITHGVHYHKESIRQVVNLKKTSIIRAVILDPEPKALGSAVMDYNSYQKNSWFQSASKGSKDVGFVIHDLDSDEVWVADYNRFVGIHADIISRIDAHLSEEALREERMAARRATEISLTTAGQQRITQQKQVIKDALIKSLGQDRTDSVRVSLNTEVTWVGEQATAATRGSVELPYEAFLVLANKLVEKEAGEPSW